jgi:hypothetical protein
MRYLAIVVLAVVMVGGTGCEKLTPEGAAKVRALESEAKLLSDKLLAATTSYEKLVNEYTAIKLKVDAGVPLTAAAAARLEALAPALVDGAKAVKDIYAQYQSTAQKKQEAADAGAKWYWQIPWEAIIGAAAGAAGLYFAKARPAIAAAQGVAGVLVTAIRDYNTLPESDPREIKDVVLETALAAGNSGAVHALTQQIDP